MKSGKTVLLVVTLLAILALAVFAAWQVWTGLEGVEMSTGGILAMIAGVVFSLGLGMGLMFLVFYSNRRERDDPGDDRDGG